MNLRKLTLEEASHYYTKEEDNLGMDLIGFTLIPDPDDPKWDNVTYYTGRLRHTNFKGKGKEYVYVLSNESMPGILKIGYTSKHPDVRAKEISGATGVATDFKVEYAYKCHEGRNLEQEIHKQLNYCRLHKKKEHFTIDLDNAIEIIEEIGQRYV
jgi:hypothetical protein